MNLNLKPLLIFTTFIGIIFLLSNTAKAQESSESELKCYNFTLAKAQSRTSEAYDFCIMSKNDSVELDLPINGFFKVIGRTATDGVCLDDDNQVKAEGEYGTHCGVPTAIVATNDACTKNDLKGCIASRLPTKAGVAGVVPLSGNLIENIARVVNSGLGLLGLIFTTYLIYAGIQWIHYGGNSEGISRAAKRIKNAIIGLAITLSAYSLSYYILSQLAN